MKTLITSVLLLSATAAIANTNPVLECKYEYTIYDYKNLKAVKEEGNTVSKITKEHKNPGGKSTQYYAAISIPVVDDVVLSASTSCKSSDFKTCDFLSTSVVRTEDAIGNQNSAMSKNLQVELRAITPLVKNNVRYSVISTVECIVK